MRSSRWASSPPLAGLILLAGALAAPTAHATDAPAQRPATGRLLVLADRPSDDGAARAAVAAAGARRSGPAVPQIGLVTVRPRRGETVAQAARRLSAAPGVAAAQPERRMRLRELPNDPALALPDPVAGTPASPLPAETPLAWPLLQAGFPGAWDVTRGEQALVGVIDTGVDASHPDLAPKIAHLVDQQTTISYGPAGTDDDGHGTHVASLACAATGNGIGIAGAGHDCRLVIEKTDLTDGSIAAAIVDATDRGVHAINMSFGDDGSRPASVAIRRALQYAAERDVVLVAAAADEPVREQGDPSNVLQPTGSGPDIEAGIGLSVTAATYDGERAPFAGYGSQISLAAYGTTGGPGSAPPGIVGAFPLAPTRFERAARPCNCRTSIAGDSRYGYLAGTSMAAPQVAATAALVRALNPDLSGRAVVRLLKRTAERGPGRGWNRELGWGVLDAERALTTARETDARPPDSRASATALAGGRVELRWSVEDTAPPQVRASGARAVELVVVRLRDRRVVVRERVPPSGRARTFEGRAGERYGVLSRAFDRAGNREPRPRRFDDVVRARK
ncbi:S8 family serine peptidase [Conexibacter stalactiti]|uniref:S8 family serine peptidase n=1 Tax=Conexibacter stalactiti TaxID=1940611 RepID=A0ABU4HLQ3_9ACTN|nr:S8 family serine peptidase [Conexibacter stalactiti]MDW5594165.1 S8 family serine peptidase [Conexibacter stalactiti]MEC5034807.1 S8 family serine peptidase [Conexibacter stalactiti]